jgi:thiosulfate dehydrogenase
MADMYDRFTGLLLTYELRQMQCYINSSNGFKPNAADDLMRDVISLRRAGPEDRASLPGTGYR